jgi:hypothetical protein
MKKAKLLLLSVLCTVAAHAQLGNDGYYRIQNVVTSNYISPSDNYGYHEEGTTIVDVSALKTIKEEDVISDPGSVIYIKQEGSNQYNLLGQGYQTKDVFPGYPYLSIWDNGDNSYKAYVTEGAISVYLVEGQGQCATGKNGKLDKANWYIKPMSSENYFGVKADIENGNGEYFKSFFAAFPFTVASDGLKAYTIANIDEKGAVVTIAEAEGEVAGATPVIFKALNNVAADNLLTIGEGEPAMATVEEYNEYTKQIDLANGAHGAFFCNPVQGDHRNVIKYDPSTMRVLGTDAQGNLAFVKAYLEYIPANTAFIKVTAGSADTFLVIEEGQVLPQVVGDLDHDNNVTIADYVLISQMAQGIITPTLEGDLNGDGEVTVADARILYNMILNAE